MLLLILYIHSSFDPLGRPSITAGWDHCFCTCRPYVRPHFSNLEKQNNRKQCSLLARLWAGRVDHWWQLSCDCLCSHSLVVFMYLNINIYIILPYDYQKFCNPGTWFFFPIICMYTMKYVIHILNTVDHGTEGVLPQDLERQVHFTKSFRRCPGPGLSSDGACAHYGLGGSDFEAVELAEDDPGQEVRLPWCRTSLYIQSAFRAGLVTGRFTCGRLRLLRWPRFHYQMLGYA